MSSKRRTLIKNLHTAQRADDFSLYEDLLNTPLFEVPSDLGRPGEDQGDYPKDALGTPDMKDRNEIPQNQHYAPDFQYNFDKGDPQLKEMHNHPMSPRNENHAARVDEMTDIVVSRLMEGLFPDPIGAYYTFFDYVEGDKEPETEMIQRSAKWTRSYINNLPDNVFAAIEPAYTSGETDNKNARHLPHHCAENVDVNAALSKVLQIKPVTNSISKDELITQARTHLEKHAEGVGENNMEKSAMNVNQAAGHPAPKGDGPNGSETFPKEHTDPEYTPPGQKADANGGKHDTAPGTMGVPHTEGPTDPLTFPKNAPHEHFTPHEAPGGLGKDKAPQDSYSFTENAPKPGDFSPPGNKTGGPMREGPTDNLTFPQHAPDPSYTPPGCKASDLGNDLPVGPQGPEFDRHNPYLKMRREKDNPHESDAYYSGDKYAPEVTPGLEHIYNHDDGHLGSVERAGQEVDLSYRRYKKYGENKDFKLMADRFRNMREAMCAFYECAQHNDGHKIYAKDLFALSYGQLQYAIKRELVKLTKKDVDPDFNTLHELTALKADLLGDASKRFITNASKQIPICYASLVMADSDDDDDDDGPDTDDDSGDTKEMKKDDVESAAKIALMLVRKDLIKANDESFDTKFVNTLVKLAEMSPEGRQDWLEMASSLSGKDLVNASAQPTSPATPQLTAAGGVEVANANLVGSGIQNQVAGRRPGNGNQNPSMIGAFLGHGRAPLQPF